MNLDLVFVLLFSVATAVALVARRLNVPYTVALVIAGLVLGVGRWFEAPHLSKDLLFAVFLPGLLFEAAFHLDAKKFWANKLAISTLAVPGVVAAICATAFLLTPVIATFELEPGFRLIDGFVFGGIVAATDPIAVVALFKSLGAPKRLGILIEGESLLNDGTAVVLFAAIFGVATGTDVTIGSAVVEFVRTCGLGVLVGVAVGYAGSRVIHLVDDPMIEMTVTVVLAWGSFALAEAMHTSGVLATVASGLLCGNSAARTGMSPTTKIAVGTFWAYIAFALNSIVFLLIGLEVELAGVLASWEAVLIAWLATTLARIAVVGGVKALLGRTRERLPPGWATVMCWGGIRGGLSMVLALALPLEFPHRQFLINVVFGVVVISILLQGMTMGPLLKKLGVTSSPGDRLRFERVRAEGLAVRAALGELDEVATTTTPTVIATLRAAYEARWVELEAQLAALHASDAMVAQQELLRLRRHLVVVEKERVQRAVDEGLSSDEAAAGIIAELDAREVALEVALDAHDVADAHVADDKGHKDADAPVATAPSEPSAP